MKVSAVRLKNSVKAVLVCKRWQLQDIFRMALVSLSLPPSLFLCVSLCVCLVQ